MDFFQLFPKTNNGKKHLTNNNKRITTGKLWKDGLHLANSRKGNIISNVARSLNISHFLTKQPNRQIPSFLSAPFLLHGFSAPYR